jgi:NTE family protein
MSATTDLFNPAFSGDCLSSIAVHGGSTLYAHGDVADSVFLVRRGLFAVMRDMGGNRMQQVGYVRPGECVGEMSVLTGLPRGSTVIALRDSIVDAYPAAAFLEALQARPNVASEIAHLVVQRSSGNAHVTARAQIILISAVVPDVDPVGLAQRLAQSCRDAGIKAAVLDRNAVGTDSDWIGMAEAQNDLVLLTAQHHEHDWLALCHRQVDRIMLMGRSDMRPPPDCPLCTTEPLLSNQLVDLVLERPAGERSRFGQAWLAATNAARLFHVDDRGGGVDRLARILNGTSVGLALSGGGARAFAHVGVIRALREAGVTIDLVCGTSMGAIVGAGLASGWDNGELDQRMRAAFVTSSPLDDIALPIVAMTRGRKVEARLAEHFGDVDIADLDLPYFCVSANLTSGHHHSHDRGPLARALRASISLPGVLPPVIDNGQVLVDGGVLRNLPTDLLRTRHDGTVIGSDVSRAAGLSPEDVMPPASWWRWLTSGAWRRGPPIVSILMRTATISAGTEIALARNAADLYVMPDTGMVEIRDWRLYPQAVEAGYVAMRDALENLDAPVSDLRKRRMTGT